jgi:hypothetical protein
MLATRVVPAIITVALLSACAPESPLAPADLPLADAVVAGSHAPGACQAFRASGQTFGISPYAFQGQASVWIGTGDAMIATVTTTLTGAVKQGNPARGAQVVTTSHFFDFGDGNTFVTEDIARLIPTRTPGVSRLLSTLRIVSGTGAFADVATNPNPAITGDAQSSTMDFTTMPPVATWSFDARICGYDG